MNKTQLVEKIAQDTELTKVKAAQAVDSALRAILEALQGGDKVSLIGFGTFQVVERAARTGRNPQTGKAIKIPAGKLPRFRPGKGMKDAVNVVPKKKKGAAK